MKIPIGTFGYSVPEPVDNSAVSRATDRLGQIVSGIGEQRQAEQTALLRTRALNVSIDHQTAAKEAAQAVADQVDAGELDEVAGRQTLQNRLAALKVPVVANLDRVTVENLRNATRAHGESAMRDFDSYVDKRRRDALLTEATTSLQALQRQAGLPGADVAAVNAKARALKSSFATAGVPQSAVAQTFAKFDSENWENHADRRLIDGRDDPAALHALRVDLADAQGLYADKIDPDKRNGLLRSTVVREEQLHQEAERQAREDAKQTDLDASREAIEMTLLGGGRLDPTVKEQRDYVDKFYAAKAQDLGLDQPITPILVPQQRQALLSQATQLGVDVAARTGIVPRQLESFMRTGIASPQASVAAIAADGYGRLKAAAPELVAQIDPNIRTFAELVNSMVEIGTDPTRAVETARAQTVDAKPELLERRRAQWREESKGQPSKLAAFVDRDFDPGLFASEPGVTERMKADFDAQTEKYFMKVGDADLARDLAWADLTHVYGETRVNGDAVLSLFPVEKFGVKPEEVRADIASALHAHPAADGSKPEDILVVPDSLTLRSVTDAQNGKPVSPTYALVTKSGDLLTDAAGQPLRYALPTREDMTARLNAQHAAAVARGEANVEQAKRDRVRRRALDAELTRASIATAGARPNGRY